MVQLGIIATSLVCLASTIGAHRTQEHRRESSFPDLPFTVDGPQIIGASNASAKYAGTNWPGHGAVMVPEGLQYQSIETIVSDLAGLGMNAIRLTYAIQMVDEIYTNGGNDIDLQTAFTQGLGQENGTTVLKNVLANNPRFGASTKRLEVFDAVAEECAKHQIYIHLDNHISQGAWCCSQTDGSTWWGDKYFDSDHWVRGLSYMANHGKSWNNLGSMSLRNELRKPTNNDNVAKTYNWETWYSHIQTGADAIHKANSDVLIFLSGLNFDTNLQTVVRGKALSPSSKTFSSDDFKGYGNKLVLELHNYESDVKSKEDLQKSIYSSGAQAMDPENSTTANVFPVILTEFGFEQDGSTYEGTYATGLAEWLPDNTAGWMQWELAGSYYDREGAQDDDESWGLYNHDFSGWRDSSYVTKQLVPMIEATLN